MAGRRCSFLTARRNGVARHDAPVLSKSIDDRNRRIALYNLIVTGDASAWNGQPYGFPRDRFGEFTAPSIRERLRGLNQEVLGELQTFPVLLAFEDVHDLPARVARIVRFFETARADLRFGYEFVREVAPIPAKRLADLWGALDVTKWEMNRTHWAVKDVDLLHLLQLEGLYQNVVEPYDVALSFAGEDRAYVEQVAVALRQLGVSVFYDMFEEARLWGEDLYVHLSDVYGKHARFTVMFISDHYANKLWTNHERRAAQERAFAEREAVILPARFDDTQIPGLLRTTGHVDLRRKRPEDLAVLIHQKIQESATRPVLAPRSSRFAGSLPLAPTAGDSSRDQNDPGAFVSAASLPVHKHQRDLRSLEQLFGVLDTQWVDAFLAALGEERILDGADVRYIRFAEVVGGARFRMFDRATEGVVRGFLEAWERVHEITRYGDAVPGRRFVRFRPEIFDLRETGRTPHELREDLRSAVDSMQVQIRSMVNHVHEHFPEIDFNETDTRARDSYDAL